MASRQRYADGGGLTAAGRTRRKAVWLLAAELFAQDLPAAEVAKRLRVSHNAVYVWRRRWPEDGEVGLASTGASGAGCRLSPEQLDRLCGPLRRPLVVPVSRTLTCTPGVVMSASRLGCNAGGAAACHARFIDPWEWNAARHLLGKTPGERAAVDEADDPSHQPPDPGVQLVLAAEDRTRKLGDFGAVAPTPVADDTIPRLLACVVRDPVGYRVQYALLYRVGAELYRLIDQLSLGVIDAESPFARMRGRLA